MKGLAKATFDSLPRGRTSLAAAKGCVAASARPAPLAAILAPCRAGEPPGLEWPSAVLSGQPNFYQARCGGLSRKNERANAGKRLAGAEAERTQCWWHHRWPLWPAGGHQGGQRRVDEVGRGFGAWPTRRGSVLSNEWASASALQCTCVPEGLGFTALPPSLYPALCGQHGPSELPAHARWRPADCHPPAPARGCWRRRPVRSRWPDE